MPKHEEPGVSAKKTRETKAIETLLKENFTGYPRDVPPEAYRYNSASIRVRLVHKSFKGKSRAEREDLVLPLIHSLPEETQADIMILLLLAPDELDRSLMNMEFENPTPSRV